MCCMGGKMPSASAKAWVLPACKIVPSRPQPHCFLLPVALELWVYIQKMHRQQERYGRTRTLLSLTIFPLLVCKGWFRFVLLVVVYGRLSYGLWKLLKWSFSVLEFVP